MTRANGNSVSQITTYYKTTNKPTDKRPDIHTKKRNAQGTVCNVRRCNLL